jgi:hypothetical protein
MLTIFYSVKLCLCFFCRVRSEDYGVMGVRYGSENLSVGASFVPISCIHLSTANTPPFLFYLFVGGLLPQLARD